MPHRFALATALLFCAACGAVTSRAPIKSTPAETTACAGDLLGSMGYQIVDEDPVLRAERAKHVAFGRQRADYDRVSVAVIKDQLRVRGETVAMSGNGGASITIPSRELRADVKRITALCGGES